MTLASLTCSNCMAPLPADDDGDGVLRCAYCGRSHRFVEPPPPQAEHAHPVGAKVAVEWHGRWWDATVLERVGSDRWKIHYDGWGSHWDEVVGPERIRDRASAAGLRRAGSTAPRSVLRLVVATVTLVVALAVVIGVLSRVAGEPPAGSTPIADDAALTAGQSLQVQWRGTWYPATVVRTYDDGRVRVHYEGYDSSWDEDVERDRLRSP